MRAAMIRNIPNYKIRLKIIIKREKDTFSIGRLTNDEKYELILRKFLHLYDYYVIREHDMIEEMRGVDLKFRKYSCC